MCINVQSLLKDRLTFLFTKKFKFLGLLQFEYFGSQKEKELWTVNWERVSLLSIFSWVDYNNF